MAAEPDQGAPRLPDTPALGELLVERGLLTPQQLETALEEQRRTSRRLGDIIVELGFTTAVRVAQALATQHGGLFKSEYGTALGFDTGADPGPAQPPPVTDTDPAGPPQGPAAAPDRIELRLVPGAAGSRSPLESESRDAQEQLHLLAAELDAAVEARDAAIADATTLAARIEALEERLARRADEAPEPSGAGVESGSESQSPAPVVAEPEPADRHLVFLAGQRGYRLLELPGPVPAAGSTITLPDGAGASSSQLVVRVGRAPLPGSALRCAYLLPA